jgi:hypothetical protein
MRCRPTFGGGGTSQSVVTGTIERWDFESDRRTVCKAEDFGNLIRQAMEIVWPAAGLQAESLSWVVGLRKCIRPVCGAELLAIMESAHRWSTKTAELKKFAFPDRLEQRRF